MKSKLIVITGPTASGKTLLALKLAKKFPGEIVSADSRQIYRGMDIGTAKAGVILEGIPHYLIDIKNPDQSYTLAQYKKDALKAIDKIIKKGKIPFLVGGSGLYLSAVIENLKIPRVKPDKQLRAKLERERKKYGLNYLFGKLTALDPEAAYIVDPKNPRRVVRALEITLSTKKPFSAQRKKEQALFDFLILGIALPEAKLKSRISSRADEMVKQGLVREVKTLVKKYGFRRIPFDAIGYREIIDYLKGKISLKEALKLMNQDSWRFVKRQLTWFKKMPVVWIKNQREAEREIKEFLYHPPLFNS